MPEPTDATFLHDPPQTAEGEEFLAAELAKDGFVMNANRVWASVPSGRRLVAELHAAAGDAGGLTMRQRGIIVTTVAASLDDSYCALAWGKNLADAADPDLAAAVLRGELDGLDPQEQAIVRWVRLATTNPNGTTADDVQALRDAGLDERQIVAITVFAAARRAFSTVHDALGARPDRHYVDQAPPAVREAVTFGRAPMEA